MPSITSKVDDGENIEMSSNLTEELADPGCQQTQVVGKSATDDTEKGDESSKPDSSCVVQIEATEAALKSVCGKKEGPSQNESCKPDQRESPKNDAEEGEGGELSTPESPLVGPPEATAEGNQPQSPTTGAQKDDGKSVLLFDLLSGNTAPLPGNL